VGKKLGVSRTALYRHFANKGALLGAVAKDGFRKLRNELLSSWDEGGRGRPGFVAMGSAYVRFAVRHPAHYRVMFGGVLRSSGTALPPDDPTTDAFGALVAALIELQEQALVRPDEPERQALFVWSVVHGVAMLALDGILETPGEIDALSGFANERLWTGIVDPSALSAEP
jgi:AcrR family transcriptional regulator